TVGSVGKVIDGLKIGGDAGAIFDSLKEGLAAPLGGMGISFSSSLFGLAGSLILGFLDLQTSQAQNRFYIEVEDWLSTTVRDLGVEGDLRNVGAPGEIRVAIERLKESLGEGGAGKAATAAMANLAEAIHGLVNHMRTEQQMIRDWADSQAEQQRDIKRLLERLGREDGHRALTRRCVRLCGGRSWRWREPDANAVSSTGPGSSTRCRPWFSVSCSCSPLSWWCSFICLKRLPARTQRWLGSTRKLPNSSSFCPWRRP